MVEIWNSEISIAESTYIALFDTGQFELIKNLKGQHEKLIIDTIYNYEAFYTGDLTDVINELKSYGITAKQIQSVYKKNYHTFDM